MAENKGSHMGVDRFALEGHQTAVKRDVGLMFPAEQNTPPKLFCMECGRAGVDVILVLGKFIVLCGDCVHICSRLLDETQETTGEADGSTTQIHGYLNTGKLRTHNKGRKRQANPRLATEG